MSRKKLDIKKRSEELSGEIDGFVYLSESGNYFVIVNNNLSEKRRGDIFLKQSNIIRKDKPQYSYSIQ